jgi:hypothetical protein
MDALAMKLVDGPALLPRWFVVCSDVWMWLELRVRKLGEFCAEKSNKSVWSQGQGTAD